MRHLAMAIAFTLAACGRSGSSVPPSPPETLAADSIARAFFDQHHLVGLAVGIVRNDSVFLAKGYGRMALGSDRPVTDSTIFHLASITKPFVATAVMQLVEQGKVQLDQPVAHYVTYFTMKDPRAAGITVRQVLTHTAGLPDVTDYAWGKPEYDAGALERYIRGLKDSTLVFAPSTDWRYSNIGFELLADLVAVVSGQPFEDYIQQHILTPLKMRKSTLLMTDVDSTLLASGHERDSTGVFRPAAHYPYNRRHAGSSTLHSNVIDMLRWARANLHHGALDGGTILEPASYDSLWRKERDMTAQLTERARQHNIKVRYDSVGIGLSWMLASRHGLDVVTHSGGDTGFRSDLMLVPDRQVGVVLLTNDDPNDLQDLTLALIDLMTASGSKAP